MRFNKTTAARFTRILFTNIIVPIKSNVCKNLKFSQNNCIVKAYELRSGSGGAACEAS